MKFMQNVMFLIFIKILGIYSFALNLKVQIILGLLISNGIET